MHAGCHQVKSSRQFPQRCRQTQCAKSELVDFFLTIFKAVRNRSTMKAVACLSALALLCLFAAHADAFAPSLGVLARAPLRSAPVTRRNAVSSLNMQEVPPDLLPPMVAPPTWPWLDCAQARCYRGLYRGRAYSFYGTWNLGKMGREGPFQLQSLHKLCEGTRLTVSPPGSRHLPDLQRAGDYCRCP